MLFEQRGRGKTPLIIVGFGEGLVGPVVELMISGLITAVVAVSSATGAPNMTWFFGLFATADLVRNIVGCILHTQYAIGHVAGSIFGIAICYGGISLINKEVADSSLLTVVILTVSLVIGIIVGVLRWKGKASNSELGYY
jgi:flagellar biosynthesis protein FliR